MYYILYQTTNQINYKIYIGVHSTEFPDVFDGYLGSGIALKKALKKYGRDNFSRQVLCVLDCAEDAYAIEELVVDLGFIGRADTYNIALGGVPSVSGEIHYLYKKAIPEETKMKMSKSRKGRKHTMKSRKLMSDIRKAAPSKGFSGKSHTTEYKINASVINKGENNPLFKGWWHTPEGVFDSLRDAAKSNGVSHKTISNRCLNNKNVIRKKELKGICWLDLGWWFEVKEDT